MTTGQTILTIGAFIFLTTIMLNFYQVTANTGDTIVRGQDGILATTVATSYLEIAQGLAFDQVTDTSNVALSSPALLTSPSYLGSEAGEDSMALFNDFDDFNNKDFQKQASGTNRVYQTHFTVYYVNPDNLGLKSGGRSYTKRMDLKTWRVFPPATSALDIDTVRLSAVLGYFHFD